MLNSVIILGRLGKDPEIRSTAGGNSVVTVSVAVDRSYTDKSGHRETDWIPCVFWNKNAEFVGRYFHKGSRIIVDGTLQSRSYEDRDGNKRSVIEVVGDKVDFVDGKSDGDEAPRGRYQDRKAQPAYAQPAPTEPAQYAEESDDGDLPF